MDILMVEEKLCGRAEGERVRLERFGFEALDSKSKLDRATATVLAFTPQ